MDKKDITEEEAIEQMNDYAGRVKDEDVAEVLDKEEKAKGFFKHVKVLEKYWDDVCDVFGLLRDSFSGAYSVTPWKTIAALVGALMYVISPFDLIPDFIPLAGYIDDAGVFGVALKFAEEDLAAWRAWKKGQR